MRAAPRYTTAPDVEASRRRLAELLGEANDGPIVRPVAVNGTLPSDNNVDLVRRELFKLPPRILADDLTGWTVDVVPGDNARAHPKALADAKKVWGSCYKLSHLIVVAGRAQILTTLHEAGHAVDSDYCVSHSRSWRKALKWDDSTGEEWAELFAYYWHSTATRASLTADVRNFMQALCRG